MQYVVMLTDRDTGAEKYRIGEPGSGGVVSTPDLAKKFDTRAEAEAYVGRLVTWKGFEWTRPYVTIEEYQPESGTVDLTITRETAQYVRNLIGYLLADKHMGELRSVLHPEGFVYQPSQFQAYKSGLLEWKGNNASD